MLANIREVFLQSSAPMKRVRWLLLAGLFLSCASVIPAYRIPQINEELNLTVYNASSARQLEEAFEQDLKYSKQITYAEWNSRGIGARICELFAFSGQRIPRSKNTYDVRFRGATNQGAHGVFLIQRNLVQ